MAAPSLLWRYILRDVLLHALLGLSVITLVLIVQNVLRFLERLMLAGAGASDVLQLVGAILPSYVPIAVPTALLFGVLVSFGRMSADGEIIAMRSSGLSVYRMLPPVLALACVAALSTTYLTFEVEPQSRRSMKVLLRHLTQAVRVVRPGAFITLGDHTLYVNESGEDDCPLRGVLIGDVSDPERRRYISARCGSIEQDEVDGTLLLTLRDGAIDFDATDSDRYRRIRFAEARTRVDLGVYLNPERRAREHTTAELLELLPRLAAGERSPLRGGEGERAIWIQIHRRAALGAASIALALLAVPLGIQPLREGRSWGALTAIGVMTLYWGGLAIGETVAEAAWLPIAPALWLPNATVTALAVLLLRRTLRSDV